MQSRKLDLPSEIIELLRTREIGYLSVLSPQGKSFIYPMVFWFDGRNINMATSQDSAKLRFIRGNPNVSFEIDNQKLTLEAQGLLIHGRAEVFDQETLASFFCSLPTRLGFLKKYPHLSNFYARGQELPEDKKIQRYRIISIRPKEIQYWIGYKQTILILDKAEEGYEDPDPRRDDFQSMSLQVEIPIGASLSQNYAALTSQNAAQDVTRVEKAQPNMDES